MGQRLTRRRFVEAAGATLAAAYAIAPPRDAGPRGRRPTPCRGCRRPARSSSTAGASRTSTPATQPDAFRLQGFNAARDRLWQIDLWRRRGLGRLSAALGRSYVEQDRAARLFLYRGDIGREFAAYGDDAQQIAAAFAEGVNAYIDQVERGAAPLPVEFEALGYRPERWAAEDVVRIRSHGLVSNLSDQVDRALVLREFGRKAERLRKRLEPRWRYEVPDGLDLDDIPEDVLDVYELAIAPVEFAEQAGSASRRPRVRQGSNNWTIAGRRTSTGRPILANDPHRTQGVPSLRYLAHIVAPGLNVIGAGEPALPGISIGHNEHIAFGLTIFAIDQEDLYVYRTREGQPGEYRYRDGWEAMTVVEEEIPVKDAAPERVTLRFTRHGPVIAADERKRTAFAVRSVWFEPGTSAYFASIAYMRARNWREFVGGLRRWGAPGENQVYADRSGHIGWKPCGFAPIRRNWDGLLPVPGDGRYEWDGFLDADLLPVGARPEARLDRDGQRREPAARLSVPAAQDRLRVGGAVPAAPHPVGAAPAARRLTRRLPAPPGRPPLAAGCADDPAAGPPRAPQPPHAPRDPAAAALGPRAPGGLRRRRAVRDLELDRAADGGAAVGARLPEGRRRDLARRPDRDPRAARAPGPPPRPPSAARPRPRAAVQPRARDRPHRGAARHALVALGVGQAARRPLRAPDRPRGRRGARPPARGRPGAGRRRRRDRRRHRLQHRRAAQGGRGHAGRTSRSPPAPRSAR